MIAWAAPIFRGAIALALAMVITFSADHSAALGIATLGIFGISSGASMGAVAMRSPRSVTRSIQFLNAIVAIAVGTGALITIAAGFTALAALIALVATFAVITGSLELFCGFRERGENASARDWSVVGAATLALALAVLVIPPDFVQQFSGPDGVARELTASVIIVGLLSAYLAVVGVYLAIAGLSLKWADQPVNVKKAEGS